MPFENNHLGEFMDMELLDSDGSVIKTEKRGGARAGAGRKPPGYQKPKETMDFDKARARKESALADLNELDYKVKSGQYVSREAVKQACTTIMATLAQTSRSVSDNLERRGVDPKVCVQVDLAISEALAETGKSLQTLWQKDDVEEVDLYHPDDNSDLF